MGTWCSCSSPVSYRSRSRNWSLLKLKIINPTAAVARLASASHFCRRRRWLLIFFGGKAVCRKRENLDRKFFGFNFRRKKISVSSSSGFFSCVAPISIRVDAENASTQKNAFGKRAEQFCISHLSHFSFGEHKKVLLTTVLISRLFRVALCNA